MESRKIIHIDMDAFFAAIEQRDHPELRGIPIAVGHDSSRGVVSTASYEARKYGVRSAISMVVAKRLCPHLVIVDGHHRHYKEVSEQVHEIFMEFTDLIEPVSIDEAFLDVTANCKDFQDAINVGKAIQKRIYDELQLTASVGISYNKFLSKIASDYHKPNGMFVITPADGPGFIASLPVEKIWGVGPRTQVRMHKMGIFTGAELRKVSMKHLQEVFGKVGQVYYDFARGIDLREVKPSSIRKSVGCERTFEEDVTLHSQMIIELYHTVVELVGRLQRSKFRGKTLTLKVKYSDFQLVTRSITSSKDLLTKADILPLAKQLLAKVDYSAVHTVRLIGLAVSNPQGDKSYSVRPQWIQGKLDFGDGWDDKASSQNKKT